MEHLCPVCNGLTDLIAHCPQCGSQYEDLGSIVDYFGPYAPYQDLESYEITGSLVEPEQHECIHMASCPQCHAQDRVTVNYIDI